jgi:predicted RNA binding protein YcfA (HicA-like mRNA interferase family)
MSHQKKLLAKLLAGKAGNNFSFDDLVMVLLNAGYTHERTAGSHAIFRHATLPCVNIQKRKDEKAKNYQVRQVRDILKNNERENHEK